MHNDLVNTSNRALAEDQKIELWSLFSTTPVGLALITTGILYFVVFGRFVLPTSKNDGSDGELAKLVGIKILPGKKYKLDNKVVVVTSSQASILALYVDSGISQVKQILQQLELY